MHAKLPGIGSGHEQSADSISVVNIGHNTAMLTYHLSGGDDVIQKWCMLTLNDDYTIGTEEITGPPNPQGVVKITFTRVGEVVVAYGGRVLKMTTSDSMIENQSHRGTDTDGELYEDVWFMSVYSIDTAQWEAVPCVQGCPTPDERPRVFGVGDTLVVNIRGPRSEICTKYDNILSRQPTLTWEWSLETRLWTQCGDGPPYHSTRGFTAGACHHIYDGSDHTVYSNRKWLEEYYDDGYFGSLFSVHMYGEYNLRSRRVPMGRKRGRRKYVHGLVLGDIVSLEQVPLALLPDIEPTYRKLLDYFRTVMLNPYTLLLVASEVVLMVDIDPRFLGPEIALVL
ncbi:hypothetical protein KIPB_006064 [Kipferlia bialata]|uniref:Uncharacterized protein n=1 Tax=Kipferlia bialata TaxID=797122 RepID=A0A9K3CYT4_9EUKA|nr:hypothetical protein KIPB_006064 [Kipferlia bialata]|eukprot:g6064.t1